MKDSADSVRKQATDLIDELIEMHFSKLRNLAFRLQPKQRDILLIHLDEYERTQISMEHDFIKNKDTEEEKLQYPTKDEIQILNEEGNPTDYLLIDDPTWAMAPNGLAFGIIPRDVMTAAEIHNHVGERVLAFHKIEKILEEQGLDNITKTRREDAIIEKVKTKSNFFIEPKNKSEATRNILNYGSLFLRYISIILEDTSKEVLTAVYKILKHILAIPGFGNKANFQKILVSIIKHSFKHNSHIVRNDAQMIVMDIMLTMKSRTFISTMSQYLDHEDWHIREECLKAIII